MEQNPSWEINNSKVEKFSTFYETRRSITILSYDIPIVLDNMMVQGSTVEPNL